MTRLRNLNAPLSMILEKLMASDNVNKLLVRYIMRDS